MNDSRWERFALLGGVVFVVLDAVVAVVGGEPPGGAASASEISAYFADHAAGLEAGLWLFGIAAGALIWWSGSLWRWMVRAEGGSARLAVVSIIGLVLAGALSLAASAVWAAMALHVDAVGSSAPFTYALGGLMLAASGFGVATHVLATSIVGWHARALPVWLVGCAVLSAAAFIVSGVLTATSTGEAAKTVGLAGYVLWCLWILGITFQLWREATRRPTLAGETTGEAPQGIVAHAR
jgi:hypothetical protein